MSSPQGNPLFDGLKAAHRRTIYKGAGLDDVDIRKPHIGIVNAYTDASPFPAQHGSAGDINRGKPQPQRPQDVPGDDAVGG